MWNNERLYKKITNIIYYKVHLNELEEIQDKRKACNERKKSSLALQVNKRNHIIRFENERF